MKQQVIATRLADRHRGDPRAFAESYEFIVEASNLEDVLDQVAEQLLVLIAPELEEIWRWSITIGEPYEDDGSPVTG